MNYSDLIGIKYKAHGRNKEEGFDCFGLCIEVLKRNGITLRDLYTETKQDINCIDASLNLEKLQKPCVNSIIAIKRIKSPLHLAVYIGNGMIIHSISNCGVLIEPLTHYSSKIQGVYKVYN